MSNLITLVFLVAVGVFVIQKVNKLYDKITDRYNKDKCIYKEGYNDNETDKTS